MPPRMNCSPSGTRWLPVGPACSSSPPQGAAGEDIVAPKKELEWMQRLGAEIDCALSFALIQVDADPNLWREQLDISAAAHEAGSRLHPQIAARPFGMLLGFPGHHAFTHRPTYRRLKAECTREELAARLAEPAVRAAILAEDDLPIDPNKLFDGMFALAQNVTERLHYLGEPPNYEPTDEDTVAAIARERGQDPLAAMYDLMLEADAGNLTDRGVIGVGKKADVNVIDMEALTLHAPRMAYDLPAGGHPHCDVGGTPLLRIGACRDGRAEPLGRPGRRPDRVRRVPVRDPADAAGLGGEALQPGALHAPGARRALRRIRTTPAVRRRPQRLRGEPARRGCVQLSCGRDEIVWVHRST